MPTIHHISNTPSFKSRKKNLSFLREISIVNHLPKKVGRRLERKEKPGEARKDGCSAEKSTARKKEERKEGSRARCKSETETEKKRDWED